MSRTDELACARIVRRHAHTFALASRFLPPCKRRAAFALYAFCRVADDMVDAASAWPADAPPRALADYAEQLAAAVRGEPAADPVLRELQWAVRTFGVPAEVLGALVAGVARDLEPVRYRTWEELARYCEGVASTVGEMCTWVFGVVGGSDARERALRYARVLGVAMQLTNVLRDVGEDARRGRCYLPEEDLAAFGLMPTHVLAGRIAASDERWRQFMAFEVGRAHALYDAARPGIALLAPDAQRCATACAVGYAGILDAIESIGYDSLNVRAHLDTARRLRLLWSVWRTEPTVGDVVALGDGPVMSFPRGDRTGPVEHVTWA